MRFEDAEAASVHDLRQTRFGAPPAAPSEESSNEEEHTQGKAERSNFGKEPQGGRPPEVMWMLMPKHESLEPNHENCTERHQGGAAEVHSGKHQSPFGWLAPADQPADTQPQSDELRRDGARCGHQISFATCP
jgi:hypothetical protein